MAVCVWLPAGAEQRRGTSCWPGWTELAGPSGWGTVLPAGEQDLRLQGEEADTNGLARETQQWERCAYVQVLIQTMCTELFLIHE